MTDAEVKEFLKENGYPEHLVKAGKKGLIAQWEQLSKRLEQEARRGIGARRQLVAARVGALDALSPLAILARGFSILRTVPDGHTVRKASDVVVGQTVQARLGEGQLMCVVSDVIGPSAS